MRTVTFFAHTTLDGFIADARGELWSRFVWGEEQMAFNNAFFRTADTWVLGRRMYEAIVPWWDAVAAGAPPEEAGALTERDHEFAALQRAMTRVVVSRTLDDAGGTRVVVRERVAEELLALKRRPGRDVVLSCGPDLLALLAGRPGLVDQYLVVVHPAALGRGVQLFGGLERELPLALREATVFEAGCVALRYGATG
jgi:dihydrofolate reductase